MSLIPRARITLTSVRRSRLPLSSSESEHSWENVEARRGGALYQGNVRMELGEFLRQGGQEHVKRELERVLTSVFEEQFSAEVTL